MPNTIKVKRGLEANRTSITPAAGEFLYTTDQKKVYIGDGTTAGGVAVAPTVTQQVDLIATANASGAATVDFTGLSSAYSQYFLVASGISASSLDTLAIRTSSNNGTSWDAGASDYNNQRLFQSNTTITGFAGNANNISFFSIGTTGSQTYLYLQIVNTGLAKNAIVDGIIAIAGAGVTRVTGMRLSTTAVNGVRLLCLTGGVTLTGTFKLYGVKA